MADQSMTAVDTASMRSGANVISDTAAGIRSAGNAVDATMQEMFASCRADYMMRFQAAMGDFNGRVNNIAKRLEHLSGDVLQAATDYDRQHQHNTATVAQQTAAIAAASANHVGLAGF